MHSVTDEAFNVGINPVTGRYTRSMVITQSDIPDHDKEYGTMTPSTRPTRTVKDSVMRIVVDAGEQLQKAFAYPSREDISVEMLSLLQQQRTDDDKKKTVGWEGVKTKMPIGFLSSLVDTQSMEGGRTRSILSCLLHVSAVIPVPFPSETRNVSQS